MLFLKRVIKFGWQNFWRSKSLAFEVIFVLTLTILVVTGSLFFFALANYFVGNLEQKLDMAVFFKENTPKEDILALKEDLFRFSDEIEFLEYVSREEALRRFKQIHQKDSLYLEALKEIGKNPFLPSLNIKAKSSFAYAKISSFLEKSRFKENIYKISYFETEKAIKKLFSLTRDIKKWGMILSGLLAFISFLVTLNTIKLTIFHSKEEISTMKIVGAAPFFLWTQFLFQGILYGIFSVIFSNLFFYLSLKILTSQLKDWLLGFSPFFWYKQNFFFLVGVQIAISLFLTLFSSFLALRKSLKK